MSPFLFLSQPRLTFSSPPSAPPFTQVPTSELLQLTFAAQQQDHLYLQPGYTKNPIFYTNNSQGNLSTGNIMPIPSYRKLMRAAGPKHFPICQEWALYPQQIIYRGNYLFSTTKPTINIIIFLLGYKKPGWEVDTVKYTPVTRYTT